MDTQNRILAVDPGEVNLGIALSDPTQTIASPLTVIRHTSRDEDAQKILALADEHQVETIVIGQALDWDGGVSLQGRKAARLAGAVKEHTEIQVVLWNEYGSTQKARQARRQMGVSRKKRGGHLDEIAAAVILQSYLDDRQL
jgi:putative Holliday junction resolvase